MQSKILKIELHSIEYGGENIGRDLLFIFSSRNSKRIINSRITHGTSKDFLTSKSLKNPLFELPQD